MVLRVPTHQPDRSLQEAPVTGQTPYPESVPQSNDSPVPAASSGLVDQYLTEGQHSSYPPGSSPDEVERSRSDSESYSIDTGSDWDSDEDIVDVQEAVSAPSHSGLISAESLDIEDQEALPAPLRIGPVGGTTRRSLENERTNEERAQAESVIPRLVMGGTAHGAVERPLPLQSHNPYLQVQATGNSVLGSESSASVWSKAGPSTNASYHSAELAELPTISTPTERISKLSLQDEPEIGHHENNSSPQSDKAPPIPARAKARLSGRATPQPPLESLPIEQHNPWGQVTSDTDPGYTSQAVYGPIPDEGVWKTAYSDVSNTHQHRLSSEVNATAQKQLINVGSVDDFSSQVERVPELPPRRSLEQRQELEQEESVPPKPPRPTIDVPQTTIAGSSRDIETPRTRANRQRSEHYQIKRIRWQDTSGQIRQSPILTQNANGPCPLLALVNALVLSTPLGTETALVEALRTREQVSLGLLLDAVFDELMSGRRGDGAQDLPDVGELYTFLITLHTGMNVNPRFISPTSSPPNIMDSDTAGLSDVHPSHQDQARPGTFEETREMRLYSTFELPLMHGWVPAAESPAYEAFSRAAKTYEDAQNILFHEEVLEEKLQAQGLTQEEQQALQDITIISDFLSRWPTQLTDYGLSVIERHLEPGQIAILFRNDHFLTLYKEPRSKRLFTLVTDAGYAGHEEIVWESLTDVSGQDSGLFSGDFRPVGNAETHERTSTDGDQGWTTVESRNRRNRQHQSAEPTRRDSRAPQGTAVATSHVDSGREAAPPKAVNPTEQEDHDLALALQLQEEEEDRHRREEARRRREEQLSQQFLSNGNERGQEVRPLIPPRRNNANPRANRQGTAQESVPPPTYQQSASDPPFTPQPSAYAPGWNGAGVDQAAYAQQSATISPMGIQAQSSRRRRASRMTPLMDQIPDGLGGPGRRRPAAPAGAGGGPNTMVDDRDRCVLM